MGPSMQRARLAKVSLPETTAVDPWMSFIGGLSEGSLIVPHCQRNGFVFRVNPLGTPRESPRIFPDLVD